MMEIPTPSIWKTSTRLIPPLTVLIWARSRAWMALDWRWRAAHWASAWPDSPAAVGEH